MAVAAGIPGPAVIRAHRDRAKVRDQRLRIRAALGRLDRGSGDRNQLAGGAPELDVVQERETRGSSSGTFLFADKEESGGASCIALATVIEIPCAAIMPAWWRETAAAKDGPEGAEHGDRTARAAFRENNAPVGLQSARRWKAGTVFWKGVGSFVVMSRTFDGNAGRGAALQPGGSTRSQPRAQRSLPARFPFGSAVRDYGLPCPDRKSSA